MSDLRWILGSSDPEMSVIEELLRSNDQEVEYARWTNGERVHRGICYEARNRDTSQTYWIE